LVDTFLKKPTPQLKKIKLLEMALPVFEQFLFSERND
jgi:hypothetical protein